MKALVPTEPKELKALMQSFAETGINDQAVVWSGNRLPKYLWDSWKSDLRPRGFTWQRFMRLLRYRTDLGVMWYRGAMPWEDFVENVLELIDGPLGQKLAKQSTEVMQLVTVRVPIVGSIAAGDPIFAEEEVEGHLNVSSDIAKRGFRHFALHVKGNSMDKVGLLDGDLALVRQQPTAEEGEIVVALIENEATIKEFHREGDAIVLKPRSTNKQHKPIVLNENLEIQGVVISSIRQ